MGRKECSVKCEVWRKQWEVKSVKCGVWSVECEVSVWSAKSAVWSVKCEVWSVKEAVRSVKCGVWSLECEECSVKCGVWSVKTLLRLSLKKSNGCRGKDTVGTGCLWTIGHLCLGNFRRRLARVYVINYIPTIIKYHYEQCDFTMKNGDWRLNHCFSVPQRLAVVWWMKKTQKRQKRWDSPSNIRIGHYFLSVAIVPICSQSPMQSLISTFTTIIIIITASPLNILATWLQALQSPWKSYIQG